MSLAPIDGYVLRREPRATADGSQRWEAVWIEGSHYGAGPQSLHECREHESCPFCGAMLGDFSAWWFGQHWSCVLRSRALATRWAWLSGEGAAT